jgi:Zn-dependent alcohol dehydrogenase
LCSRRNAADVDFKLSVFDLTLKQKRIQGSMFGGVSPSWDILKMVRGVILYDRA